MAENIILKTKNQSSMFSQSALKQAAKRIGCNVPTIQAVGEVESDGSGFLKSGEVKILFEPHIFYARLIHYGLKPKISDICYKEWKPKNYGKVTDQHTRLQRAVEIHKTAALESASWGAFQILGVNWRKTGATSLQEFINEMHKGVDNQLLLFVEFIINSGLSDELRRLDWDSFARQYNGKSYKKNKYDTKLAKAYLKYSK